MNEAELEAALNRAIIMGDAADRDKIRHALTIVRMRRAMWKVVHLLDTGRTTEARATLVTMIGKEKP